MLELLYNGFSDTIAASNLGYNYETGNNTLRKKNV